MANPKPNPYSDFSQNPPPYEPITTPAQPTATANREIKYIGGVAVNMDYVRSRTGRNRNA